MKCIFLSGFLIFLASACSGSGEQSPNLTGNDTLTIKVQNLIQPSDGGSCKNYVVNTVTIFLPDSSRKDIPYNPSDLSGPYQLDLGAPTGLGIQVNFWYWTQLFNEYPVGTGPHQNPDNSGANFVFKSDCTFTAQPPVYGDGKETYKIADVSSAVQDGVCVVTIRPNKYTGCVTPKCCSPFDGPGKCGDDTRGTYECANPPL